MPEDDDNAGGGEGMVRQVELDYYDNMGRNSEHFVEETYLGQDTSLKFSHIYN